MHNSTIWSKTQSLLVFYVYKTEEEFNEFRVSLDEVLNDCNVKRIKVVVLIKDLKQDILRNSLFAYISEKDIHFFTSELRKKAKNEFGYQLDIVRHTAFDLLLSFGEPTPKVLKWLMKIQVKERIGVNINGLKTFDLILQSSKSSISDSVTFTRDTLIKIKKEE